MKKFICIVLTLLLISIQAHADFNAEDALQDTAQYIYSVVTEPQFGSIGGEWAVLGLARSGYDIPAQNFDEYYERIEQYVTECNGVLHNRKYTEYSRLVVALTAIDKDPTNVAGHNLLTPLGDYDSTVIQGINGAIWALIALDCGSYDMPVNPAAKNQATRDMYLQHILDRQLEDGGFALGHPTPGKTADPDVTGMVVQAFSNYQHIPKVKEATDKALLCLSNLQDETGGYSSWDTENCESCVQVLVALCEMGIPIDDPRFVKNGNTLLDNLMSYYVPGQGFMHTKDNAQTNLMASEQGLYALAAIKRIANNQESLYNIKDGLQNNGTYDLTETAKKTAIHTVIYILLNL